MNIQNFHFKIAILIRGRRLDEKVVDLVNQLDSAGINNILFLELRDAVTLSFRGKGWSGCLQSFLRLTNDVMTDGIVKAELFLLNCKLKPKSMIAGNAIISSHQSRKIIPVYRKISGGEEYIKTSDLAEITQLGVDILVQIDSPKPLPGISAAGKSGLLELSYGSNTQKAAPRPGFWTSYYRKNKTEFQIRHYQPGVDSGRLLLHGAFSTKHLFSENYQNLIRQGNAQLTSIIMRLVHDAAVLPIRKEQGFDFSRDSPPGLSALLIYALKSSYRLAHKLSRRALNIRQKWSLSLSIGPWMNSNDNDVLKIEPPQGKFWADPFLLKEGGQIYCFFEEYDYKKKKGHISVLSIDGGKIMEIGRCIEQPFHLSFPYLFRYAGHIYMCPEASASNKITIYRSQVFPLKWVAHSVAMENISAADTMIFEFEGKWWMFTNIDTSGTHNYCSALHIFHSETPVNGRWTAHAMNPIIVDPRGGRNGGLIMQDGRIFRGAQVQGYAQYGQGIIVNEIVLLNEFQYVELERKEFGPCRKSGVVGVHHISSTGDMTIIDQLTNRFRA